jgi:endonuclease/exonuclease/phosphatase family metal-dependent hydrolase
MDERPDGYTGLSLNAWGGIVGQPLLHRIKTWGTFDVLWLQEVPNGSTNATDWSGQQNRQLFRDITRILPHHRGYFVPVQGGVWGIAMFVRAGIVEVLDHGAVFVHRWESAHDGGDALSIGRAVQWMHVRLGGKTCTFLNFHGLWSPEGKGDSPERDVQSGKIIEFARMIEGPFLLAGDFNYLRTNRSLAVLVDELGLTDHIQKNGILSTRTSYYTKPDKDADYLLTKGVGVSDFRVLPDQVSDHAPLAWRFSVT